MNQITSRLYKDQEDLLLILELIDRVRPSAYADDHPNRVNLEENFASATIRPSTRLWFENRQLMAWAYVDDFRNVWWELNPDYEEFLGRQIVEWGLTCIRGILTEGETSTLDTSCRESNTDRLRFLDRHGFKQIEAITVYMTRSLLEEISEPKLPEGFGLRSVTGLEEAEAIASTHRAAFGTDYMSTERRIAIMSTSEYDPSLDLVIVAPDGTIAAYCTCSVNQQKLTGATDPVATHPRYQGMGLARALLLTGLHLLKQRGMQSAYLGTSGDNLGMQKAAESVGFKVEYRTLWFSKEIK